jgi:TRAP-type C4-dicarboxylate transport system permease small subunit
MQFLAAWLARIRALAAVVTTLLFAAIFLIFLFAIFMRYVMQQPVAWADELNIILLLWVMFIAGALVLRDNEHVAFDVAWNAAPPAGRRAMGIVSAVAFGGLFLAALPGTWSYITFLWRERTTVLEWRLDWVYACYLVFFIAVIIRFGARLIGLIGPGWRNKVQQ